MSLFDKGFAFICEGDTEKVFYIELCGYLFEKHGYVFEKKVDNERADIFYIAKKDAKPFLLKFHAVGTITQVPHSGNWFENRCVELHKDEVNEWTAFLCYDTDSYTDDISKFYEGDWLILRNRLSSLAHIVDVAASATIEDVLLTDLTGICRYYSIPMPSEPLTFGRSGKAKLKMLLRPHSIPYHSGTRAQPLIQSLDMECLLSNKLLPIFKVEETLFASEVSKKEGKK